MILSVSEESKPSEFVTFVTEPPSVTCPSSIVLKGVPGHI